MAIIALVLFMMKKYWISNWKSPSDIYRNKQFWCIYYYA